jgi:hypothetical protein
MFLLSPKQSLICQGEIASSPFDSLRTARSGLLAMTPRPCFKAEGSHAYRASMTQKPTPITIRNENGIRTFHPTYIS